MPTIPTEQGRLMKPKLQPRGAATRAGTATNRQTTSRPNTLAVSNFDVVRYTISEALNNPLPRLGLVESREESLSIPIAYSSELAVFLGAESLLLLIGKLLFFPWYPWD
ncbi:unnamed protein product [Cochlearia groenlandica]